MRKFAVSNIAWPAEEDGAALELLKRFRVRHVELAPSRFWASEQKVSPAEARAVLRPLFAEGFTVSGFQALMFGKPHLTLFDEATRPALLNHLTDLARLCSQVGGKYLVFGAPKNRRRPDDMDPAHALKVAQGFFRNLGFCAERFGVAFGIEANPAAYGCNFCTHVEEVIQLVRAVDSGAVRWHLDTGELAMNSENTASLIAENADLLGSVHVSQPDLGDFSEPWAGHAEVSQSLRQIDYKGFVSLEMKRSPTGLESLEQAAGYLTDTYF